MALDPGYYTAFQMDFRGRAIAAGLDGDEQRVVRALVRPVSELTLMRARQGALHAELLEPALLERVRHRLGVDLAARGLAGRPAATSGAAPPVNRDLGRGARAAGLGAVVGGLRAAGTTLTTVGATIQKAGDAIGGAAGAAVTQAGKDIEKVGEGLGRLAGNVGSLDAPGAIEAAGQTLAAAVALVGNALEAIGKATDSPALIAAGKAVQDFGNHVEAYAAGAAAVVSILADAATGAVVDAIGVAAGAIAEAGRAIGDAIGAAAGAIADGLAALWDLAVGFVGSLFAGLDGHVTDLAAAARRSGRSR
jgi:hypothetical protein